jgi:Protein of unknown function (DUF2605)
MLLLADVLMLSPHLPESDLLKAVLEPLLDDFLYWFGRSQTLLETESLDFLSDEEQSSLLGRLQHAQQEIKTARLLLSATDGQAGVETSMLMMWHHLVTECWQVSIRFRTSPPARVEEP